MFDKATLAMRGKKIPELESNNNAEKSENKIIVSKSVAFLENQNKSLQGR